MKRAIGETARRREIQRDYNERNGIVPESIVKPVDQTLVSIAEADYMTVPLEEPERERTLTGEERERYLAELEAQMREAAKRFEFEKAAQFRDRIKALRSPVSIYEANPVSSSGGGG